MRDNQLTFEFVFRDGSTYRLKMSDIEADHWCEAEEQSGMDAGEIMSRFVTGGYRARKVMYWLARKQSDHPVKWDGPEMNWRSGDMEMRDVTKQAERDEKQNGRSKSSKEGSAPDPQGETGRSRSPTRSRSTSRTS